MAQQSTDINSILAALQHRPSSTPGQSAHTPPTLPPGYPAPLSTTPSSGVPPYGLPQPTNSGSLDLSSIKPGGSYDGRSGSRSDPRRPRRSRSRSRSPPRREAYRDNYNPYRDERRDDRGRNANGYGRERSFSPGRREPFSPTSRGYGTRSPVRNADGSETITVDSSLVGLIIGRQGENLRRVEQETGARVQFVTGPEGAGAQRQCKVSGTARQIEDAKREIFRVIEENPQAASQAAQSSASQRSSASKPSQPPSSAASKEAEKSMQIMVPDRTVGLIIGRGGETIRDLQERSGCHVNIVGENKSINGLRPVNLIGSREASAKAKDLIMEIVESDTRGAGPPPRPMAPPQPVYMNPYDPYAAAYPPAPYGAPPPSGGNEKINDRIMVPSDAVGMIIGKGGETIKQMQDNSGCKINVSPPSGPDIEREIGLIGSRMAIESAKRLIWDKVETAREKSASRGRGGPPPREHDPYSAYPPPQQPPPYGQPAYGQPPYGQPPQMPPAQPMPAPVHGEAPPGDPYAAYGGYQNYMALWYAALAGQPGGPPPHGQGEPSRPPGQ